MWSMIKGEFRHIIHNRLLLLSVTVICFIPFLYSIFFLKSVWDPYGSTRNLPVAVVNKDIPVEYQGQKMDVGKQTVNELKKNHQLKWEFVSAKEAKYGMSHRKYYAVVTIPKDFSENATTVLQKHPKTMKLHYQTNGSLNYIGQVIAQTGMTRLNEKIRAQVTNAYATVMFKQLHVVGKGMNKAADGAQQIGTGMVTLSDGVNRYVAGVSQVNNGVQTLRVSVAPLASGAQQLATGSQTLANGIMQYTGGVSLLGNGVGQLMANSGALNSGANQLSSGLGTLMANSGALNSGASQLNAGLGTLDSRSGELQSGANQLASGSQALANGTNRLASGTSALANGSKELNARITNMIPILQNSMTAMSGDVQQNATALRNSLAPLAGTSSSLNELASQLGGISSQLGKLQQAAQSSSTQTTTSSNSNSNIDAAKNALSGIDTSKLDDASKAKLAEAENALNGANSSNSTTTTNNGNKELAGQIGKLKGAVDQLQSAVSKSAAMAGQNTQQVMTAAQGLENSLNSLQGNSNAAISNISGQLTSVTQRLADGANTVNAGVATLNNGANALATGAQTAQAGIGAYTTGVRSAAAGANQLASGIGQYTAGVAQAGAGADQLASGIGQYTAGVGQLGNGIAQLNANSGALNSGAAQLAGALGQLNGQVPALVAGVNQLAAGTQQLQDNSPALISGIARLNAGASQLATSLAGGAKQINGIKTSPRTAKMFAEPTALKHTDYSYVPNYGHALAPYVLSLAIYVGALVFNFVYPIRRVAEFGKAPIAWWASKVTVGSLVVTAMAITEDAIMMACGLTVIHPVSFFVTTICFGLASMAIVMFLSMLFDNPGRFFAMVLLMLQLGGSGGTFPMEITMKFYNVIHWYLPMTYSILGLRDSISGGLGAHYTMFCNTVLIVIAIVFYALLLVGMIWLQHHHYAGRSELDNNQELLGPEGDYDGMHLQQRRPNQGDNGEQ